MRTAVSAIAAPDRSRAGQQVLLDATSVSRWFSTLLYGTLPVTGNSTQIASAEEELWVWPTQGTAEVFAASGSLGTVSAFDGIFLPAGTSATVVNRDDAPLTWLQLGCGSRIPDASPPASAPPTEPVIFRRKHLGPHQWPANDIGATAKPYWFYTVKDYSAWFHSACISALPPGGATAFHSHLEEHEGPYETWYLTLRGSGLLRSEVEDFVFDEAPGGAFVPAGAPHQMLNNGEDFLWYLTISSRGPNPLVVDTFTTPAGGERPGYKEEYDRIMESRRLGGLPTP